MPNQSLNKKINNQFGFSMLEVVIAVTIFAIIIIAWNNLIIGTYKSSSFGQEQLEAIRQAQKGIEQITKEIREMSTSANGAYALELAGDNELIFYSDIDQDVLTEKIHYYISETNLYRSVIEPSGNPLVYNSDDAVTTILAQYINNSSTPMFTYYNGDYPFDTVNNPLPAPARLIETKLMHIFLRINITPERAPNDFDVESDIQLRNLKANL